MIESKRRGWRRGRFALAGLIAAVAVSAFGAGSANAAEQDFTATFDDGNLNLPVLGTRDIIDATPATMVGTVEDTTGDFNVDDADFDVPEFTGEVISGVDATVNFAALEDINGNVNQGTGVLTTQPSDYQATVEVLGATCHYNLLDRSFDTGSGIPFSGDTFTVDTSGGDWVLTNGMMKMNWPSLPASVEGGNCSVVDNIITTGCGGLEFAVGVGPNVTACPTAGGGGSTTPPPASTPPAKKKKCKKKKGKKGSAQSAAKKCKKKKK